MEPRPKKLLDQVRDAIRLKHYAYRTEETYVQWVRRSILFHHKRHPNEMGTAEIEAFLTHLAVQEQVAASTQNQALNAILFLYREVLKLEVSEVNAIRAKRTQYVPTVLTPAEAREVIQHIYGVQQLVVKLLYGVGYGYAKDCAYGSKTLILLSIKSLLEMERAAKVASRCCRQV